MKEKSDKMLSFIKSSASLPRFFAKASQDFINKVNAVIDERIRPVLQMDGGDIILNSIEDGIVNVTLTGHCSGCPSRRQTLNFGILSCLQEELGEDKIVEVREKDEMTELE